MRRLADCSRDENTRWALPAHLFVQHSAAATRAHIGRCCTLSPQVKTTLLVSLAWMIFNMIPPYLLMHYQFVGRGTTLKIACK